MSQENAVRIHRESEFAPESREPVEQESSIVSSDRVATAEEKKASLAVPSQSTELALTNSSARTKNAAVCTPLRQDATSSYSGANKSDAFHRNPQWLAPSFTAEKENGLPALPLKVVDRGWTIERNLDPANRARQIADSHRATAAALLEPTHPFAGGGQYASDRDWISPDSRGQFARSNQNPIPVMTASSRQLNSANRPTDFDASIEPLNGGRNVTREFQGYEYDRPDFRQPDHGGEHWQAPHLNARPNHQPVWIPPVLNLTEAKTSASDSYYTAPTTNNHPPSWQTPLPTDSHEKWIPPRTPSRLQDYPQANPTDRFTDRPLPNRSLPILER